MSTKQESTRVMTCSGFDGNTPHKSRLHARSWGRWV